LLNIVIHSVLISQDKAAQPAARMRPRGCFKWPRCN